MYGKPSRYEHVVATLRSNGLSAQPVDHKISRQAREKVLLKAQLLRGGMRTNAAVRNIPASGAMIEGDLLSPDDVGAPVSIELL